MSKKYYNSGKFGYEARMEEIEIERQIEELENRRKSLEKIRAIAKELEERNLLEGTWVNGDLLKPRWITYDFTRAERVEVHEYDSRVPGRDGRIEVYCDVETAQGQVRLHSEARMIPPEPNLFYHAAWIKGSSGLMGIKTDDLKEFYRNQGLRDPLAKEVKRRVREVRARIQECIIIIPASKLNPVEPIEN